MPTSKAISASKLLGKDRYEYYLNELLTEKTLGGQKLSNAQIKEAFKKRTNKISFEKFVDKVISTKTVRASALPGTGPILGPGVGGLGPKGGSIVNAPSSAIQKYIETQKTSVGDRKDTGNIGDYLKEITSSLGNIIKILNQGISADIKNQQQKRRDRERAKREGVEKGLEKGFAAVSKVVDKVVAPVKSILSRIIDFFLKMFLARAIVKLIDWLADKNNQEKIQSLIRFFGDNWTKLLSLYIVFGTSFGKFARGLISLVIRGGIRLGAAVAGLAVKAGIGKAGGKLSKVAGFLGGKKGKLLAAGLEAGATVVGTMALSKTLEGGLGGGEQPTQKFSGGGLAVPRFSGGGFNFKGMLGGAGMGAMFGPLGMLLGGALGGSSGFVSGPGGPKDDKVPAMLSDGEFVMSAGAVQKYGVDTFEAMNAAGGGTNKPRVVNGTTYAAGGGYMGDYMKDQVKMRLAKPDELAGKNYRLQNLLGIKNQEEVARLVRLSGNKVPDIQDLLGKDEYSRYLQGKIQFFAEGADEKTFKALQRIHQQHFGVGPEFEKMMSNRVDAKMLDRSTTPKPTSTSKPTPQSSFRPGDFRRLSSLQNRFNYNPFRGQSSPLSPDYFLRGQSSPLIRQPIPASSAIVPYTGGGLARTGVTGGLSVPKIKTNMRVPGGFGNLKSLGAELLLSYLVQSGLDYVEAKRLASTIEKARKESPEKLANRIEKLRDLVAKEERFQKSFSGILQKVIAMGGETGSEVLSRQAKTILAGVGANTYQGGAIKGGYGLKQQSFKDMPKTQIMTDDKGRPFVGYKAMRGGKPVYVRGPQPGEGTSNPFEMLGRMINPGAYKDIDAKNERKKYDEAARNNISSLKQRGASQNTISRTQAQLAKTKPSTSRTPVNPPTKPKPKVTVVAGGGMGGRRGSGAKPSTTGVPGVRASHPQGTRRNQGVLGIRK